MPVKKSRYTEKTTGIDVLRSDSYKAGEMNLKSSQTIYGDVKRNPKKNDAVR